jgi:hypothetical protein
MEINSRNEGFKSVEIHFERFLLSPTGLAENAQNITRWKLNQETRVLKTLKYILSVFC